MPFDRPSKMAQASRQRRPKQDENTPIIHFYEEFVNKSSTRRANKCRTATLQQHIQSRSEDRSKKFGKSQSTETTRSTTTDHGASTPATSMEDPPTAATTQKDKTKQIAEIAPKKRLTLYERSQIRLKEREKKIQSIREEMMREYTFRPQSNFKKGKHKSNLKSTPREDTSNDTSLVNTPAGKTEATTPTTASSTRQYWQDLQRKQLEKQHPQHLSVTSSISRDGSKTVSTTKSMRFEELYQDGLRRARQRPATEKVRVSRRRF